MRGVLVRLGLVGVLVVVVVGCCGGVAWGEVFLPWFRLGSVSRPGRLLAGVAHDAVQDVTVSGAPGELFVLADLTPGQVGEIERGGKEPEKLAILEVGDSPGVVQAGLEEVYGVGNVEVSGGVGAELGLEPYVVTFKGVLTYRPVAALNTELSSVFNFKGTVAVKVVDGGEASGVLVFTALNLGDATAEGVESPVRVVDRLPVGVRAIYVEGNSFNGGRDPHGVVACSVKGVHEVECVFAHALPPYDQVEGDVGVVLEAGAHTGEVSEVLVSGGGAPGARFKHKLSVAGGPREATPFGVEGFEEDFEEVGGVGDAQAGSHPFQFTTTLDLNETASGEPAALAKDLSFRLPPGLVGNPTAYPRCSLSQFSTIVHQANECPAGSVVGVAVISYRLEGELNTAANPIFNLEPSPGEPARFGIEPATVPAFIGTSVRTGEDYGVVAHVQNVPQAIGFVSNTVTLWGVPGDPRHDNVRNYGCLYEINGESAQQLKEEGVAPCRALEQANPPPFLDLPTSCTGPLASSVELDSWEAPGRVLGPVFSEPWQVPAEGAMPALDGCGRLAFGAEIKVTPDVQQASTPSGLTVDVHVPQEEALNAAGLAPADVKKITVTLPAGLALNPSASDGLQACSLAQIGFKGTSPGGVEEFTPSEPSCPNASKVATATITSPLLPNALKGFVYLAAPQNFQGGPLENPFRALVAMYLVARDPVSGTLVKLPGEIKLDQATGQITSVFANNPQLPFEDATVEFFGGDRAPLATPALCQRPGERGYETLASFEPWSNTETIDEQLSSSSAFDITTGPNSSPCPNGPGVQTPAALPFSPSLSSEAVNINAGGFTTLSTTLSREDGQQSISAVTLHYPPGLSGLLSSVKLCPEAQANEGSCPPESEIGETTVSVGVGGDPYTVTGGKVYITEHYKNAPFGLSIVNPAKAGPFVLQEGRPVVVRATIEIDPHTAALTITTDPPGSPHAIPTIIEGIPLQIRHVNVTVNRPDFTINPTNCNPMRIEGAVKSPEGATSPVSVPFQVTNCASLKFEPKFTVSTNGKTSKANGASLTTTVTNPPTPQGTLADIARVKVELPKQLPSRLTTLQQACTAQQFAQNPGGCPPGSIVGHARTITPLLPVPLEGPAYFVSHGGEAFPDLVLVLQGDGITIELTGTTFIAKSSITSSTFQTLPDAPFTLFELTLPQGPHSALAANTNLCKTKLTMPTELIPQNGQPPLHQNTTITTTNCPKPKHQTKHTKHHKNTPNHHTKHHT